MSHAPYHPAWPPSASFFPPPQAAHAGWHSAGAIHSMAGLGGVYYWPEDPLTPALMLVTLAPPLPADPLAFSGSYLIANYSGGTKSGVFYVTGGANSRIFLSGDSTSSPRVLIVQGLFTDGADKISFMLLQNSLTMSVFVPFRLF